MSAREPNEGRRIGCGWFVAFWIVPELIWWPLATLFGVDNVLLLLGGAMTIVVVFFMAYATARVLRGHDM